LTATAEGRKMRRPMPTPSADPTTRDRLPGVRHWTDGAIVLLGLAAVACWLPLYRWYSIADHYDIPYFAFEKIEGQFASRTIRWTLALFVALTVIYLAGYLILRAARRIGPIARVAIVGQVVAVGGINVGLFPVGALDVFRYMVALKTYYHYGGNPFVLGFMDHQDDPFAKHGFLLHLPNAKGPFWVLVSAIPSYLVGFDDAIRFLVALKVFNLLLLGLTAWLIWQRLGGGRRGWLGAYLFAANPLVLFEGVGNVHNDVLVALCLVGALVALAGRSWLCLPLATASALVKYFTFQIVPLFLLAMLLSRQRPQTIALALIGSLVVTVASVAPFWDGGQMLEGIDRVDEAYETSAHVGLISLYEQSRRDGPRDRADPQRNRFAALYVLLALPAFLGVLRGRAVSAAALDLYLLFIVLMTLLYPWYLIPAVALLALRPRPLGLAYLFVATGLGLAYYPYYVWARFNSGYDVFERHLFLALFITVPILVFLAMELLGAVWPPVGRLSRRPHRPLTEPRPEMSPRPGTPSAGPLR
jgi:hypothetical protein